MILKRKIELFSEYQLELHTGFTRISTAISGWYILIISSRHIVDSLLLFLFPVAAIRTFRSKAEFRRGGYYLKVKQAL